jgi:hypothetical protein
MTNGREKRWGKRSEEREREKRERERETFH